MPPGNGYIVQNWQAPLGELNLVKRHSVRWSPKDVWRLLKMLTDEEANNELQQLWKGRSLHPALWRCAQSGDADLAPIAAIRSTALAVAD